MTSSPHDRSVLRETRASTIRTPPGPLSAAAQAMSVSRVASSNRTISRADESKKTASTANAIMNRRERQRPWLRPVLKPSNIRRTAHASVGSRQRSRANVPRRMTPTSSVSGAKKETCDAGRDSPSSALAPNNDKNSGGIVPVAASRSATRSPSPHAPTRTKGSNADAQGSRVGSRALRSRTPPAPRVRFITSATAHYASPHRSRGESQRPNLRKTVASASSREPLPSKRTASCRTFSAVSASASSCTPR